MHEPQKRSADLDTTWRRLLARHEAIERQLEAGLRRAGLSRAAVQRAAARATGADPRRLAEVQRQIEAAPAAVREVSFEEISRPSPESISGGHGGRWLRV